LSRKKSEREAVKEKAAVIRAHRWVHLSERRKVDAAMVLKLTAGSR
jgi:hypothetical protein